MSAPDEEDFNEKMSELYVAECKAAKARLEVETECRKLYAERYEKVLLQAKELSKKIEAPILAKICDVGYFCDTHVVRTNQLTMEMGSSYFTECSIHTAEKIIARRVSEMKRNRQNGLESIRVLDEKMKFAKENFSEVSIDGGPIEIVEKYDEEMEKLFYENRKKRYEKKGSSVEKRELGESNDTKHDEIMSRLEELEKMEKDNKEVDIDEKECPIPKPFEISLNDDLGKLEEVEEEDEEDASDNGMTFEMKERLLAQPGVSRKEMERLLQYLEDCENESSDEECDEETEGKEYEQEDEKVQELDSDDYASDENMPVEQHEAVQFRNPKVVEIEQKSVSTTVKRKSSGIRFAEQLENVKTFLQTDTVQIKEETTTEIKSILRNNIPTPVDRSALEPEQKELAAMSSVTFPGEIVEKNPYECEPSTSKDPAPVITEKKVSKFRASRHRN